MGKYIIGVTVKKPTFEIRKHMLHHEVWIIKPNGKERCLFNNIPTIKKARKLLRLTKIVGAWRTSMEKIRCRVTITLKFDSLFDPETPIEKGRRIIIDMLKDRIPLDPQDIEIEGLK